MFDAPPSLRKICNGAFCFCKNLQRVVLNEGLETVGTDGEETCDERGVFKDSGVKEVAFPSTLVKLAKNSFENCDFLERVWVEQRCQIHLADYVRPGVDVKIFREGDEIPINSLQNNVGNDE